MDFFNSNVASFLQASLSQRVMFVDVAVTDSSSPAVTLAGGVATLELLVVLFHDLGVLLAVNTVGQVRAAGKSTRSLWFPLASAVPPFWVQRKPLQDNPARLVDCACSRFFILFADYTHKYIGRVDILGQSRTFRAHFK